MKTEEWPKKIYERKHGAWKTLVYQSKPFGPLPTNFDQLDAYRDPNEYLIVANVHNGTFEEKVKVIPRIDFIQAMRVYADFKEPR